MPEKTVKEQIVDTRKIDEINARITKQLGIPEPTEPSSVSPFPKDITHLSSEQVGTLLSEYDAMVSYIRYMLSKAELRYTRAKTVLDTFRKTLYLKHRATASAADANAWVEVDRSVIEGATELDTLEIEYNLLQARLDIFSKYSASISREISRRKNELWNREPSGEPGEAASPPQKDRMSRIAGREFTPSRPKRS